MDRNKHIKDYLAYYLAFPHPPQFAVLLDGPWGIGKTFIIKRFLEELSTQGKKHVYLSLYGLTSLDDVEGALFRAMYPIIDNKGVKIAGRALKSLGKYFRVDFDLKPQDVLSRVRPDVYVFDDLERCEVPINQVMGYINEFVEHEKSKVIIIANEKEITDKEKYTRIREKLISKTLQVQSAFEQALAVFIALVSNKEAQKFLEAKADAISSVYRQGGLNNLRILQQAIWDFERFYVAVDDKHRKNEIAMTVLLRLLLALSFELKAGRLSADDLEKRQEALIVSAMRSRRPGDEPLPLVAAQQRYPEANLEDTTLSDETISNILIRGIVDEGAIRANLDVSSFFVKVADEPAWRTVWHALERTDDEFNAAFAEMERAFAAGEFVRTGELLQVFGLRLWLSDIGVLARTRAEAVAEGKLYIDNLLSSGRIEPASGREGEFEVRMGGYGGLGIHEHTAAEFHELFLYLQDKRRVAEIDRHPALAGELLEEMTSDPDLFFRRLNLTNSKDNTFYAIPILAFLNIDAFVSSLLALHPSQQRTVFLALAARYEDGRLDRELSSERPWLEAVRGKIVSICDEVSAIARYRLRQGLAWGIDPALGIGADSSDEAGS